MVSEYRCRAEVLRYVSAEDNLQITSYLNRSWCVASSSEEVWRDLCECYNIEPFDDHLTSKAAFHEGYLQTRMLAVVSKTSICIYSVPSLDENRIRLLTEVNVDQFTSYCFLSAKSMLFSGGCRYLANCYKADLTNGEITILSPMSVMRRSHALFKYKKDVFAFGGYQDRNLDVIEKYSITSNTWETLKTRLIYPMEGLVPTCFHKNLYLVGAHSVEIFNLITFSITEFPLKLPQQWYYCIAHVTRTGELVILQREKVIRWSVNGVPSQNHTTVVKTISNGNYWSNCAPVRINNSLFFVQNTHGSIEAILKFSLENNEISVEKRIEFNE